MDTTTLDVTRHSKEDLRPVLDPNYCLCAGSPYAPTLDEVLNHQIHDATLETKGYKYTNITTSHTIVLYFNLGYQWVGGVGYVRQPEDVPIGSLELAKTLDKVHQY